MAQLRVQLGALHAKMPASVRPLLPVAIAAALGVLLLLPSAVLRAFLLGLLVGPALLAGAAVRLNPSCYSHQLPYSSSGVTAFA